jgi:hypothetical protein
MIVVALKYSSSSTLKPSRSCDNQRTSTPSDPCLNFEKSYLRRKPRRRLAMGVVFCKVFHNKGIAVAEICRLTRANRAKYNISLQTIQMSKYKFQDLWNGPDLMHCKQKPAKFQVLLQSSSSDIRKYLDSGWNSASVIPDESTAMRHSCGAKNRKFDPSLLNDSCSPGRTYK